MSDAQVQMKALEEEWELCKRQDDQKHALMEVKPVHSTKASHICSLLYTGPGRLHQRLIKKTFGGRAGTAR